VLAARIHIDPDWAPELIGALDDAACRLVRRDGDAVDVLVPSMCGGDRARVELTFFLRAWALDHPLAVVRLGRVG
jgi:hypothetical protein